MSTPRRPVVLRFVRHAETLYNTERRLQGWSDSPITPLGEQQIAAVAKLLEPLHFDAVFSSDLPRTRSTTEGILALQTPRPPVEYLESLREWNFGSFETRGSREVWGDVLVAEGFEVDDELTGLATLRERYGWAGLFSKLAEVEPTRTAETAQAADARAAAAMADIVGVAESLPGEGEVSILVVSHGGFIVSLLRNLVANSDAAQILANCSVTRVRRAAGSDEWVMEAVGETA